MRKYLILFMITMCIFPIFAQPTWFTNPKSFDPKGDYIIGIGEGVSNDDATAIAKANLVSQITVNVRTDSSIPNTSMEAEISAFYTEYISKNIKFTSDSQLAAMQVVNQAMENDKHYIMVALNKPKMFTNLDSEMKAIWSRIQTNMRNADRYMSDNNIVLALDAYTQAQNSLSDLMVKKYFYDIHATKPYAINGLITDTDIENNVRELISTISFEIIAGNQQTARRGNMLLEPISFQVSARKPGGAKELLSGLPVMVHNGDGKAIVTGKTNFYGQYHASIGAMVETGDRGMVCIQIDPSNFPNFYNRVLRNKSADAYFKVTDAPQIQIGLSVIDESENHIPSAVNRITTLLANHNVVVSDNATIFFRGIGAVKDKKVVEGANSPRYIVNVTVELQLKNTITNSMISTIRGNGNGTSDRSEADAINLAYRNLNFNSKELATIIEKSMDFDTEMR